MSAVETSGSTSCILRVPSTRRQVLKGAASTAFAAPFIHIPRVAAQDAVTVTWFAGRDTTGFTPQQVEAFNAEHPEIQIDYQEQGAVTTDLHDKFVTVATAQDSTVDIVSMDVPFVPEFAAAGWTLPMADYLTEEERTEFFPGTIDGATYDGTLYAIPWFNNGPGLFYRKDLLDEAGIDPPATYDDLVSAATELATPDISGYIFQAVQTEGGVINFLEYLWGHGGDLLDENMQVILGDSDAGVQAMSRLVSYLYEDQISPEACLTMTTAADAENVFASGEAVFLRSWMTATSAMLGESSQVRDVWDVTTLPSADGSPGPGCLGTWNLGISAYSENVDAAVEVIKWFTSLEQQTTRYLGNGNLPARPAVFDDAEVQEKYAYVDRLAPAFEALKPRPVTPYYSQMSADALQPNFGAAMSQQKSPEQAVADMADGLRQIIGG
ncbi:MAG TPA: ABC transporter substrate-binding protein [Thermomicrobiales bacterium]|nr:ABC transporter substrate-binding protein [Thermomicrobiales bacterium]